MSGQPNVDQVDKLRAALARRAKDLSTYNEARNVVERHEIVRDGARIRMQMVEKEIDELLAAMDCGPNGNSGSFQRQLTLLTELISSGGKTP